jgi:hypothetical protein
MKKFLTLLVTSTAMTAAVGALAWTAAGASPGGERPLAAVCNRGKEALPLILASDDDDHDGKYRRSSRRHHDDHDGDDDDDHGDDNDHDDNNDDGQRRYGRNPAPAGSVTPPPNGLFGNGAPPKVQVN